MAYRSDILYRILYKIFHLHIERYHFYMKLKFRELLDLALINQSTVDL